MLRVFHSFALLVSIALCGAILGGVVSSLLVDRMLLESVSVVLSGIAFGGGAGLVLAAAIALRSNEESLRRYSRVAMIMAILFLAMLVLRRYRAEQQFRERQIELVPVSLDAASSFYEQR